MPTIYYVYYVYLYLRERDGSPYYVGMGKGKRAYSSDHRVPVPKDRTKIKFIAHCLNRTEAILLETKLISMFGRKDNGTGILRNLTNGGEGAKGTTPWNKGKSYPTPWLREKPVWNIGVSMSAEAKKKNSDAHRGKLQSDEAKMKNSLAQLGRKKSTEHCLNISIAKKGKPQKKATCPHCGKDGGYSVMQRHHFNNCRFNQSGPS